MIKINTDINSKKIKIDVVKSRSNFQTQKYLYKKVMVYIQAISII